MSQNDNKPDKEPEQKYPWYLNFWILSIITLSLWSMTWLILWLVFTDDNQPNAQAAEVSSWISAGTFGDMFGCLTCLFTGISVAGIIVTLQQQKQALHIQQDELNALKTQSEKQNQQNEKVYIHKLLNEYLSFRKSSSISIYFHSPDGQPTEEELSYDSFSSRFCEVQNALINQFIQYVENNCPKENIIRTYNNYQILLTGAFWHRVRLLQLFMEIKNSTLPLEEKENFYLRLNTFVGECDIMLLLQEVASRMGERDLGAANKTWNIAQFRNSLYASVYKAHQEPAKLAASTIFIEVAKAQKLCIWADESEQEIPERFNLAEWVLEYKKREKIKE